MLLKLKERRGTGEFFMKNIMIPCILISLLIFSSCGKNKKKEMEYPVEIKRVDNVIHIINPETPQKKPRHFLLKEELSFGKDTDNNYIFGNVKKLGVDRQENIYVLDRSLYCVKIFDKQGNYIRSVSQKGEGPGEIAGPIDLVVDDKNKMIHILDNKNRKISRYHFNGSFDSDLRLRDGNPDNFFFSQNNFYLVDYFNADEMGNIKHRIIKYSFEGNWICQTKEFIGSFYQVQKKSDVSITFNTNFEPKVHFVCDQKGYLYHGFSNKYEITVFDQVLKKSRVVTKINPEKYKVSKGEIEGVLKGLKEKIKRKGMPFNTDSVKFPEYHPLFKNIWLDDYDRVLVNTRIKDDIAYIDVFNRKGVYEGKMIINETPDDTTMAWVLYKPIFKNGFIYSAVMNDEGIILVKKYRLIEKNLND